MEFTVYGGSVQIDEGDYPLVASYSWCLIRGAKNNVVYAQAKVGGKNVTMHRLIAGAASGSLVDHINRDGLDNRRANLRICTKEQNCQNKKLSSNNTSGFKGVSAIGGKWKAAIGFNRKQKQLGRFATKELAYEAYCRAAKLLHGEFARLA